MIPLDAKSLIFLLCRVEKRPNSDIFPLQETWWSKLESSLKYLKTKKNLKFYTLVKKISCFFYEAGISKGQTHTHTNKKTLYPT